jgi:hypothetical protein
MLFLRRIRHQGLEPRSLRLAAMLFTCGALTGEFVRLMEGGEGDITVPIPVYRIEHPKGRVLFDTGLHPDCRHDPAGRRIIV